MDLLHKPLNSFTFSDIQEFCKLEMIEGIQLDYKRDLSSKKGLSKHFAAFSNTRGGVIIVGVDEDPNTGKPVSCEGVPYESKLIDQIHQYASNVRPIPSYDIYPTNGIEGKVFILVRIYEGDNTPYYVDNDPNLYVRTGNITSLIDFASPDWTVLLVSKKEKAKITRDFYLNRASEVFNAAIKRGDRERINEIAEERQNYNRNEEQKRMDSLTGKSFQSKIFAKPLGNEQVLSTFHLQPFYPHNALATPNDIKSSLLSIRDNVKHTSLFPDPNSESIPEGVFNFNWIRHDGSINSYQVYSHGLFYCVDNILSTNRQTQNKEIHISHILMNLFKELEAIACFYNKFGYQGSVTGSLSFYIEHTIPIWQTIRDPFLEGINENLLNEYRWDINLDTNILSDEHSFQSFFIELAKEIHWSFGYSSITDNDILYFLAQKGWQASSQEQ